MPRQKNTKPTSIYWLYDMRPETIAAGWPNGKPFYCGKTVESLKCRLGGHRNKPRGHAGPRIVECGEFIRMGIVEVVPPEQNWAARERFWISTMRLLWPGCCLNISDGGDGAPGNIQSAETRAKIGAGKRGKKRSPETLAKMKDAAKNRSPEANENIRVANRRKIISPESRAKMSIAAKNRSPETLAKIAFTIKNRSPEARAAINAAISASLKGRKLSPETIAKRIATLRQRYVATSPMS